MQRRITSKVLAIHIRILYNQQCQHLELVEVTEYGWFENRCAGGGWKGGTSGILKIEGRRCVNVPSDVLRSAHVCTLTMPSG